MAWAVRQCTTTTMSSVTLLHPTQRVKIFGNIFDRLIAWAVCFSYAWIRKVSKNNNKGWYFENIKNIENNMIFSVEYDTIMIYIIDIIIDILVSTL